jgi:mxaD protein
MRTSSIRSLGIGLAMIFAAAGAFAAGKNLSVTEKVDLAASQTIVWGQIKDFNGWQDWHPAVASTEILKGKGNDKGTVRVLTTKDGARITEELVSYSARSMSYKYRIIDSPLPVTNYVSTLKVNKTKTGSTVVWTSSFKAKSGTSDDDAKKAIAGIYRAGLDNLTAVLK